VPEFGNEINFIVAFPDFGFPKLDKPVGQIQGVIPGGLPLFQVCKKVEK